MTAYAGNDFLLYIEDSGSPGTYLLVGGGKSCSIAFDGSPAVASDNIGQIASLVVPSSAVCSCSVTGSGLFTNTSGESKLLTAAFSSSTSNFKITFANLRQLVGSFYVTSLSRSGDLGAAESYSFSLQGDNIIASTIGGQYTDLVWDSANSMTNSAYSDSYRTVRGTDPVGDIGMVFCNSFQTAGKRYIEIYFTKDTAWVTNGTTGGKVGVVTTGGESFKNTDDILSNPYGWGIGPYKEGVWHTTPGNGAFPSGTDYGTCTVMIAFDLDAKKLWFGVNGTWLSGDPATGASPHYSGATFNTYTSFRPACSPWTIGNTIELRSTPNRFLYTMPSGFTYWGAT